MTPPNLTQEGAFMKPSNSSKPVAEIVAAIQALDLDPIKVKLMDADEGQGWSREYADRMEVAYKRFLTLLVTYPETTVAPSKEIDKFWHGHILDTMKYADDCEQVFGYFLHHFPYFGLRGADDAAQLAQAGQDMERLYQEEFGEPMPTKAAAAYCMAAKPVVEAAYCMAAKPAYCMAAQPKVEAAYCMAAKPQVKSAYCMAGKPNEGSAYCMAATPAYCMAGQPKVEAAYCMAAKPQAKSAYCMAGKPKENSAYCMAAKPDITTRPTLALAA
jgi:hypothetical protein